MSVPAGGDGVRGASGSEVPGLIPSAATDPLRDRLSPQQRRRRRRRRRQQKPDVPELPDEEAGGGDPTDPPHQIDLLA